MKKSLAHSFACVLTGIILFAAACSSTSTPTLSVPFLSSKPKDDAPILAKQIEVDRFKLDWDGMKSLGSLPKEEAREKLLSSIQSDCPNFQEINDGEKSQEDEVQQPGGIQQNAKIVRKYYWIRYRCGGGS